MISISSLVGYSQDFIPYPQQFKPTLQDSLKNLKVVVIMGYVEQEFESSEFRQKIKYEYKNAFLKYGIKVNFVESCGIQCKYVNTVCKDADIIIYNGHGGLERDSIPIGYSFESSSYSGYYIKQDLSKIINPNALVIYAQVCTGAGSSAADLTTIKDIGFDEAKRRVYYNGSVYPENSAYYACNINGMLSSFLMYFIDKKLSIQETYNSLKCKCYQNGLRLDTYKSYNSDKIVQISRLENGTNSEIKEGDYSHAFYADPNYTLSTIFKSKQVKFVK